MKKLNAAEVKTSVEKDINRLEEIANIIRLYVNPALDKMDGKKISKCFSNVISSTIPDTYVVRIDNDLKSQYYLEIYNKDSNSPLNYDNHFRIFLGYSNNPIINANEIQTNRDPYWFSSIKEDITKMKLSLPLIPNLVDKWNKAVQELEEIESTADSLNIKYPNFKTPYERN